MDTTSAQIATALAKIGLARKHTEQVAAGEEGLTPLQAQALSILALRTASGSRSGSGARSGGLRLAALAEELAVTRATTSEAVTTLEAKGLVVKATDLEDGRALALRPTAAGRRLSKRLDAWPELIGEVAAGLSAAEGAALLGALLRVIQGLVDRGVIGVQRMCVTCRHFRPGAHPGKPRPHHCALLDEPLGGDELRAECPEQEPAADPDGVFQAFLQALR